MYKFIKENLKKIKPLRKIRRSLKTYYRWLRYGDFTEMSYFEVTSPEVLRKTIPLSFLKKFKVYLDHAIQTLLKAHARFLLEDRLIQPDKLVNSQLSDTDAHYSKSCIDHQWKNAWCLINSGSGRIKIEVGKNCVGLYFSLGRQFLSKQEGTLKLYLVAGENEKIILNKNIKAIHHNWDLYFFELKDADKDQFVKNGEIEIKWTIDISASRILITPPLVKNNTKKAHKIIVLIADAIRPQDLGLYNDKVTNTPNINEFFSRAVVFKNSFSQSNWTLPSFASMATSLYASQHNVVDPDLYIRAMDRNIPTLAELLRLNGFFTYANLSHRRCGQCLGHHRGFDHFTYQQTEMNGNSMQKQLRDVCSLLRNLKNNPLFVFLHIFDTHYPYFFDNDSLITRNLLIPQPVSYYVNQSIKKRLTDGEYEFIMDRYHAKILRLDHELNELFSLLKEQGGVTVIFTSDHGNSFRESAQTLAEANIRTPFIIYSTAFPFKEDKENRVIESSVDLMPTLLSLYGLSDNHSHKRNGSRIFNDDFSVSDKKYAVSEIVFNEDYQLRITDKTGNFVIFKTQRDRRSNNIHAANMQIVDCNFKKSEENHIKENFSSYIASSNLDREIKIETKRCLNV